MGLQSEWSRTRPAGPTHSVRGTSYCSEQKHQCPAVLVVTAGTARLLSAFSSPSPAVLVVTAGTARLLSAFPSPSPGAAALPIQLGYTAPRLLPGTTPFSEIRSQDTWSSGPLLLVVGTHVAAVAYCPCVWAVAVYGAPRNYFFSFGSWKIVVVGSKFVSLV